MRTFAVCLLLLLSGCATAPVLAPGDAFMANLNALCGRSFEGRLVTTDAADADMRGQRLVMTVAECAPDVVRVPFVVGEDRSRTWVITRTASGLRLKHDHRHADGTPDEVTQYGGDTVEAGDATRQAFPADAFSKALFARTGRAVSADNVWAIELRPGQMFVYELRRPARHFRVEFDLARPLAAP